MIISASGSLSSSRRPAARVDPGRQLAAQGLVEGAAVGDPGQRVAVGDLTLARLGLDQTLLEADHHPGDREEAAERAR